MRRRSVLRAVFGSLLFTLTTSCAAVDALNPDGGLTPARNLAGRWETTQPVTFFYQTDFCGKGYTNIATATWNVTWDVTAVQGFTNVVDVEMRYTRSGTTSTAAGCGGSSGWVPLVSPTFFRATISSSQFTGSSSREGINVFGPFTTDRLTVTWVHKECIIYCYGEVSGTNALQMSKR